MANDHGNSMSDYGDYSPPPELVEAADDAAWTAEHVGWNPLGIIQAAVAFRHPDGRPELVPWEQVRELVENMQARVDTLTEALREHGEHDLRCWVRPRVLKCVCGLEEALMRTGGYVRAGEGRKTVSEQNHGSFLTPAQRAALAPFTQEPGQST